MRTRPSRWVQLRAVVRKETLQTVSDKRMVAMLLVAPLVQLVVFGYAIDFKVDRVPTVVLDEDGSSFSREHARRVLADGTLRLVRSVSTREDADRALETGEAAAALIVPKGLARKLDRGETAELQILLDGTDPNRSTVAGMTASRYFTEAGLELARDQLARRGVSPPPRPELKHAPRLANNPSLDPPPYLIPGVMAMLLVVVTTIVTAMGLAREREMGTLEQVLVTPIRPSILLVGKMVPFVVMGLFDVALAVVAGAWVFGVPVRGGISVLAVATLVYLLCTLGIGLLISTLSRTQQQSFLGGFLFAMPAILLSGVMTPIRGMPGWLQAITYLNPLRYYVEIMRANLLKGAGFADLWVPITALASFGLVIFAVASLRFTKRVA